MFSLLGRFRGGGSRHFYQVHIERKTGKDTKLQKWRLWFDIKEKIITRENKHRNSFIKLLWNFEMPLEIPKTQEAKALYLEQPDLVWTLALLKQVFRLPRLFPT